MQTREGNTGETISDYHVNGIAISHRTRWLNAARKKEKSFTHIDTFTTRRKRKNNLVAWIYYAFSKMLAKKKKDVAVNSVLNHAGHKQ